MNHLGSDLEEGEILDDSPPSPKFDNKKDRELPRRYVVRDNRNNMHKHKKGCKHAVRYHAKKLSKLRKTPSKIKNTPKKYHKPSCSRDKSHKIPDKYSNSDTSQHVFSKNCFFSQHSLIAEMKGSFKNLDINKLSTKCNTSVQEKIHSEKHIFSTSETRFTPSKLSNAKTQRNSVDNYIEDNKSTNSEIPFERNFDSKQFKEDSCKSANEVSVIHKLNVPNTVKFLDGTSSTPLEAKDDESEDEEELRRIALATCAKRKGIVQPSKNITQSINSCNMSVSEPLNNYVPVSNYETNNLTSDNYEVVDMEVDEDMQDSVEIIQTSLNEQNLECTEDLFIIDTNPSNDFVGNKENSFSEPQTAYNSTDEEFEVDMLRAVLIDNMYRKKLLKDESKVKSDTVHKKIIMQEKKCLVNPNLNFRNKRLKSAKHILRKSLVNKPGHLKCNSKAPLSVQTNKPPISVQTNKSPVSVQINKAPASIQISEPPERLIINLNDESSDDSDNSDEEARSVAENPVDSIVALISDCRQKSDSSLEAKEVIPKAVSCLSKAQQEEYNSLMKILAEKKKIPVVQETLPQKNGSVHSPLDDLKQLEKKLVGLKDTLKNKKESVTTLSKEVNSKKINYMKAKLSAQHLKERFVAAEKVRKAKLLEWSNTCNNLKFMKKSVLDLENKINQIQILCSKLGSSLQGQSYKLPLLPSSNKQSR